MGNTNDLTRTKLIDAKALGNILGLAARTIRRYDSSGKLPRPIHLGGTVRWRLAEIEEWISANCPNRKIWGAMKLSS